MNKLIVSTLLINIIKYCAHLSLLFTVLSSANRIIEVGNEDKITAKQATLNIITRNISKTRHVVYLAVLTT